MSSQHRITQRLEHRSTPGGARAHPPHWPLGMIGHHCREGRGHRELASRPRCASLQKEASRHRLPGAHAHPCVCGCRSPQMGVWGNPLPHPEPALATSHRGGRGCRAPTTGSPRYHLTPTISYTLQTHIEPRGVPSGAREDAAVRVNGPPHSGPLPPPRHPKAPSLSHSHLLRASPIEPTAAAVQARPPWHGPTGWPRRPHLPVC